MKKKNIKLSLISNIGGNYYISNGDDDLTYLFSDKDIPLGMHFLIFLEIYNYRKLNPNDFDLRHIHNQPNADHLHIAISALLNKG